MRSRSQQAESAEPAAHRVGPLISVNVGMPKDVPWQGRTVFTGVFKDPVEGPCRVGKLNIEGDGQGDLAGHGGEQRAVLVYQIDSYRYWERAATTASPSSASTTARRAATCTHASSSATNSTSQHLAAPSSSTELMRRCC